MEIEAQWERFENPSDGRAPTDHGHQRGQGNAPRFDVRTHPYRITGVDLTRIDGTRINGIDDSTTLKVISEVGTDMTKRPSTNRVAAALRLAANALYRAHSALAAFLRRKKAQLGAPKAITATAHKLARIIY